MLVHHAFLCIGHWKWRPFQSMWWCALLDLLGSILSCLWCNKRCYINQCPNTCLLNVKLQPMKSSNDEIAVWSKCHTGCTCILYVPSLDAGICFRHHPSPGKHICMIAIIWRLLLRSQTTLNAPKYVIPVFKLVQVGWLVSMWISSDHSYLNQLSLVNE